MAFLEARVSCLTCLGGRERGRVGLGGVGSEIPGPQGRGSGAGPGGDLEDKPLLPGSLEVSWETGEQ